MAKAAAATTTPEHYIWSTLPHTTDLTNVPSFCPHYDGKASVDIFIREQLPGLHEKTTFLWLTLFAQTLLYPALRPTSLV